MDSNKKSTGVARHVAQKKHKATRKRTNSLNIEKHNGARSGFGANCFSIPIAAPTKQFHRPFSVVSYCQSVSDSDSQSDTGLGRLQGHSPVAGVHPVFTFRGYQSEGSPVPLHSMPLLLPPIGVFWDIENCQVPKGRSAVAVAQIIRQKFFTGYREAEFLVVCDVKKESNQILQELNDAQVNLIHVASMCKNAADEKLRQSMRRFADIHGSPASIVLISGDINFAADISDLRHRKKINVILLHQKNASENLLLCASEHYSFTDIVESLPPRGASKSTNQPVEVLVRNLPAEKDQTSVKHRLRQLSDNCGGRVTSLNKACATIRFVSLDAASRAQKRMEGEDVFGHKIKVSEPVYISEKEKWDNHSQKRVNGSTTVWSGVGRKLRGATALGTGVGREAAAALNWTDLAVHAASTSGLYSCPPAPQQPAYPLRPFIGGWNSFGGGSTPTAMHDSYSGCYGPQLDVFASNLVAPGHQSPFTTGQESASQEGTEGELAKDALIKNTWTSASLGGDSPWLRGPAHELDTALPVPSLQQSRHQASRTPTPGSLTSASSAAQQYDGDSDEPEHLFCPIKTSIVSQGNGTPSNEPVELHISNLDQTLGAREMKKVLLNMFQEHVRVQNLLVLTQPDGSLNALLRLNSVQDAQYAISKLQRRKIGHKRINILRSSSSGPSPQVVRSQVLSLLLEVPNHSLPLFKLCELYERRFLTSIGMSDIAKLKDVCEVTEGVEGRMVCLLEEHRNSPLPQLPALQDGGDLEQSHCPLHGPPLQPGCGWAEQAVPELPMVNLSLKVLAIRVHSLLQTHNGGLHLNSLPQCYKAQFESLPEDKEGVPLEHLVSCLTGVEIIVSPANIRYLRWSKSQSSSQSSNSEEAAHCANTPLAGQLMVFSREVVDLLKLSPRCQVPFSKFIPAYHHHFGRQCRVADYGFTKLIELLEALPHVVQVMGEGSRRMVTLSHRVQLRRFIADLLRVLRTQPKKQLLLSQLPAAFQQTFDKSFVITNYGVCEIQDLLTDLSDAPIVVLSCAGESNEDLLISIPKREQTPEEMEKTKQFSAEVVELLRHAPNCSMLFNKFIPAHHIHFGWQCRVADYGFTKLIELFEAIPDVVEIESVEGERWVRLTKTEKLKVLSEQITSLMQMKKEPTLTVDTLVKSYCSQFGCSLRPDSYGCSSVEEVLSLLADTIKVSQTSSGLTVSLVDSKAKRVQTILMQQPEGRMTFQALAEKYFHRYLQPLSAKEVKNFKDLEVSVSEGSARPTEVRLAPLQRFACEVRRLVEAASGRLPLLVLKSRYQAQYQRPCLPAQLGFSSLEALLQAVPNVLQLRGRGVRRAVVLAVNPNGVHTNNNSKVISNGGVLNGHGNVHSAPKTDAESSDSKTSSTGKSSFDSRSEIHGVVNGQHSAENSKATTPKKDVHVRKGVDVSTGISPVWCVNSPPVFRQNEGPWSEQIKSVLKVTDSPAAMLSPSSNLLPAFPGRKTLNATASAVCLPPFYSYPPFLPMHIASPEPSALPKPQLSFTSTVATPNFFASTEASSEQQVNKTESMAQSSGDRGSSSSSTPSKMKAKRRLAAQFHIPLV